MGDLDRPGTRQLTGATMTVIRGRPDALEEYSVRVRPLVGEAFDDLGAYASAVSAYGSAVGDRMLGDLERAGRVRATLRELEQVDQVPAAFGRALRALDESGGVGGVARVSDPTAFQVAVATALDRPDRSDAQLRGTVKRLQDDPGWGWLVHRVVLRGSQVSSGVDAGSQLGRILGWGVNWVDLVRTESLFDHAQVGAMVRRGRLVHLVDALDEAADATHASRFRASRGPTVVDDTLRGVPRVGGGLARAGKALGWGGVIVGGADGAGDLLHGHYVDGAVGVAGAGASGVLMLGLGGPVVLGTAAVVALGSLVYENREVIGDMVGAMGRSAGQLAQDGWEAATVAGSVVADVAVGTAQVAGNVASGAVDGFTRTADRMWPW